MRDNNRIDVLVVLVAIAACGNLAFAFQKPDVSGTKVQGKQEQLVPVEFITAEELKTKITKKESLAILDLRSESSFSQGDKTIKGSLHTKVRKVAIRLRDAPRDKEVITYCACPSDEAATIAARLLLANGFKRVRVLKGGWNAWLQAGGPVEPRGL
jgi:rhodanese-related sulfurtransferase